MATTATTNESKKMTAIEMIKERAGSQDTTAIKQAIREIGGGDVSITKRMVRAGLFELLIDRNGVDAAEELYTELGM